MKKNILAVSAAAVALMAAVPAVQAQESPWLVRARAVHIDPANKDNVTGDLTLNDKTIPEVDISYFFSPNLAAELILTYPQKHDLSSAALGGPLGTLKHLPPTLSLQYHFTDLGAFKPYVGAGLNYTRFSNVKLAAGLDVERNSVGFALQAGVDYALDKNWSLNFDVKKVQIETDVKQNGTKLGTLKVDPVLIGVGVGYRF